MMDDMIRFDDPKLQRSYTGRVSELKPAKSGKGIHIPSLKELRVAKKFVNYFRGMGFGWLLEHAPCGVPVNLAKEFFTSFRFKSTTDLDSESIYFRFFNEEMAMSLREWSLRLGLLSSEIDGRGDWSQREIGPPSATKGFNTEEVWKLIRTDGAKPFKTSESKREEIADPVLQLAHIFLASNLLGHENTTITTIKIYFLWCMVKKIRVHIGYWLADSCHKIAHHPARRLYACHLVGAYLLRNVHPELLIPRSSLVLFEEPEWFDTKFFLDIDLVEETENGLMFCRPKPAKKKKKEEDKAEGKESESERVEEVKGFPEKAAPAPEEAKTPEPLPESSNPSSMGTKEK